MCPLCFALLQSVPDPAVCYAGHIAWHQTIRDGQDVRVGVVELPGTAEGEVYEVTVTWDTPMPSAVYDVAMDPQEQYQTRTVVLEQTEATARLQITSILDWTSEPRQARVVAHAVTTKEA